MSSNHWPPNMPDSLQDICLDFCVRNLSLLADVDENNCFHLKPGITLPRMICDGLLMAYEKNGFTLSDNFLTLFEDSTRTSLRKIKFTSFSDETWEILSRHSLVELEITDGYISDIGIQSIKKLSRTLAVLRLNQGYQIVNSLKKNSSESDYYPSCDNPDCGLLCESCKSATEMATEKMEYEENGYLFDCHNLRVLCIAKGLNVCLNLLSKRLCPFEKLTRLDLSQFSNVHWDNFDSLKHCNNLLSLNLSDTVHPLYLPEVQEVLNKVAEIKSLRHLDLSHSRDDPVRFGLTDGVMSDLISRLPKLVSLDISGTDLAGFHNKPDVDHKLRPKSVEEERSNKAAECSIPWLTGRYLEFLGLLGCDDNPSQRDNIPAERVTGDFTEDQILLSLEVYKDRQGLMFKAIPNLFYLFRDSVVRQQCRGVIAILEVLKRYPEDKHLQITGSAAFFYVVKGIQRDYITQKIRRQMIEALLSGMNHFLVEKTIMRNGFLTLCHFSIPQDVMFCYKRIVLLLLSYLKDLDEQDEFITRIGIYLLNCLACQVDGVEKKMVGDLGAVEVMLNIVWKKLKLNICDEIMEVAWSTLWNVTDETASNCERFMDLQGIELFLSCLKNFPQKSELLRNMMGLMGNVAEVAYLRPRFLLSVDLIAVFSELLDSECDGIEVSYNAAGVLAHILSDGEGAWSEQLPPRQAILERLNKAINRWNINSTRNINYRSFEPILRLACSFHSLESQHWAVWALCNLTKVYPDKYCEILTKENGVEILQNILSHSAPNKEIKDLVRLILDTHATYDKSRADNSTPRAVTHEADSEEDMAA